MGFDVSPYLYLSQKIAFLKLALFATINAITCGFRGSGQLDVETQ